MQTLIINTNKEVPHLDIQRELIGFISPHALTKEKKGTHRLTGTEQQWWMES